MAVGKDPWGCRASRVSSVPGECTDIDFLYILRNVRGRRHRLVQLLNAKDSVVDIGLDRDHSPDRGDFHHVVGEVRDGHELG